MGTRFLAQRLDCLPCLCLQTRSENGFVPVPITFGYRRGFATVRPARMEFLVGSAREEMHVTLLHSARSAFEESDGVFGRHTSEDGPFFDQVIPRKLMSWHLPSDQPNCWRVMTYQKSR